MALVLGSYAAFARGDIDAAVAPLHPEVEWIEPAEFPMGGLHHGPAAVAEYLRASRARWARLESSPEAYRSGADIVVLHHLSGELTDGTTHSASVVDVFTVVDGQVVRMHAYADPADVP